MGQARGLAPRQVIPSRLDGERTLNRRLASYRERVRSWQEPDILWQREMGWRIPPPAALSSVVTTGHQVMGRFPPSAH